MSKENGGYAFNLGVPRDWTNFNWPDVLRQDPCAYCGEAGGTADHIVPRRSKNSKGYTANGTGACLNCNGAKSKIPLLRFLLHHDEIVGRHVRAIEVKIKRRENIMNRSFFTPEQIEAMREAAA